MEKYNTNMFLTGFIGFTQPVLLQGGKKTSCKQSERVSFTIIAVTVRFLELITAFNPMIHSAIKTNC